MSPKRVYCWYDEKGRCVQYVEGNDFRAQPDLHSRDAKLRRAKKREVKWVNDDKR